jgi:FeS assembly SUF system protein
MFDRWWRRSAPSVAAEPQELPLRDLEALREAVVAVLRQIYDPEIPVNIYDLGLIYGLELDPQGAVTIRMTLTAPACPVAHSFPGMVEAAVKGVPEVSGARVELVWEPPWSAQRMSEEARLQLGL